MLHVGNVEVFNIMDKYNPLKQFSRYTKLSSAMNDMHNRNKDVKDKNKFEENIEVSKIKKSSSYNKDLCNLKPHFIIKEYCGRPRRESQTFFIEERIDKNNKSNIISNTIAPLSNNINNLSITNLYDNIALLGGAVVGGAVGLWFMSEANIE